MIPHHQVAIDMSNLLIPTINNPIMLHLCRDIIRKQGYEIWEMEIMKRNLPDTIFTKEKGKKPYEKTKLERFYPKMSKSKDGDCNPLFFKPDDHMKHMEHMEVNDHSYLEHMIPHHQVAVDMSKVLLKNTKNDFMIYLANRIIRSQNAEIILLNDMLSKKRYSHQSKLII